MSEHMNLYDKYWRIYIENFYRKIIDTPLGEIEPFMLYWNRIDSQNKAISCLFEGGYLNGTYIGLLHENGDNFPEEIIPEYFIKEKK